MYPDFQRHDLDSEHAMWSGRLPAELLPEATLFGRLWDLHPPDFHDVRMLGRTVKTPRWQQAYNKTYHYTGGDNTALPVPPLLQPYWDWGCTAIDGRLNGILVNWYDGRQNHYIGRHRDSTVHMVQGAPIITISLGERRSFRLRPWGGEGYRDFSAENGSVFILPFSTNEAWTHEVPASAKLQGRRISITLRVFV